MNMVGINDASKKIKKDKREEHINEIIKRLPKTVMEFRYRCCNRVALSVLILARTIIKVIHKVKVISGVDRGSAIIMGLNIFILYTHKGKDISEITASAVTVWVIMNDFWLIIISLIIGITIFNIIF